MKLAALIVQAALVMAPAWALAADLYVSEGGSDSNAGTQSAPYATISKAASVAKAGTTVHVAPGTYTGNIRTNPSGTEAARIRYVSDKKWAAKIVGTGTEFHWDNRGSYVDIVGFDISGSGRGGVVNYGSHTLMSYNHVHDLRVSGGCTGSGGAGLDDADYASTDTDIIGNVVHDVGVPGSCNTVQGIYKSNLRGRIMNNISYRNAAFGISLWHAANELQVINNTVFANGSASSGGGIIIGRGDTGGGVMTNTRVSNNIVYDNRRYSIVQYCNSGEACIGTGNTVANNLIYANGQGIVMLAGAATGTIAADPLFVNYQPTMTTGDYHLQRTSPALDKGSSLLAPTIDIDGVARPQGAGYDIGAYEMANAVPQPTPTPQPTPNPTPVPTPQPAPASLSLSATRVAPGATFTVTVAGAGKSVNEWAALYLASSADSAWSYQGNWMSLNGTKTSPSAPIASATLKFTAPQEPGIYNIRLFADDGYAHRIAISANITVAAAPVMSVSTTALSFGSVRVGATSAVKYVTVTNKGGAVLNLKAPIIAGDFITSRLSTCSSTLAAGSSCTYGIKFRPKTKADRVGSITIGSDAPVNGTVKVSLTGKGY